MLKDGGFGYVPSESQQENKDTDLDSHWKEGKLDNLFPSNDDEDKGISSQWPMQPFSRSWFPAQPGWMTPFHDKREENEVSISD